MEIPDWLTNCLTVIGAFRIPMVYLSKAVKASIMDYAATLIAKKQRIADSKMAAVLSTFWYIIAAHLLELILSVTLPTYKEIIALAYEKKPSDGTPSNT